MRISLSFIVFFMSAMAFGKQHLPPSAAVKPAEEASLCNPESLPADVQNRLKKEYGIWKVQEPSDLTPSARKRWKTKMPLSCPGIATGHFDNLRTSSHAIFLVSKKQPGTGYRFLVFSPIAGQTSYGMTIVEQSDDSGSGNFFVHTVENSEIFDRKSILKYQVHASEGILLVDSAENEYEADVYFLARGGYQHQPLDR